MRGALFLAVAAIGIPVALAWIAVRPVSAHGFGERYDLPLPLSLFVLAGGAAVALSFVIAAVFLQRGRAAHGSYPRLNLLNIPVVSWLAETWVTVPLRAASLILTIYVIGGALIGSERAALNPAPAAVYVAFWVGLSFFSALLGNLWALVNPWKVLWTWFEYLADLIRPGAMLSRYVPYPSRLSVWPAVLVFAGFAFLETVVADSAGPRVLGWILVGYTVYNLAGMFLFGRDVWLRNAEGFTLVFGFMARFSVTEVRAPVSVCEDCSSNGQCHSAATDCVDCYECYGLATREEREWNLRPPVAGLNRLGHVSAAAVVLVVLLLSTVSFDGLSATPEWLIFATWFELQWRGWGSDAANLMGVLGLPVLFGILFAFTCSLMTLIARRPTPAATELVKAFAFSLLPIALAYHFAHFVGFLFVNGQRFIVLVSDPFGRGWDLFGTADAIINIGILSPTFIWYFSMLAIVIGHIAGVYLAHVQAVRIYGDRATALRSQLPMLVLMVCYTCASLWIISRPISE